MDNKAFISIEFLFSIFILLIIATGLVVYSSNAISSSLNIESNFNHRIILDNAANTINQVNSNGESYSQSLKLPQTNKAYVITLDGKKLTIEFDNKKAESSLPFVNSYSKYKLYPGHTYVVEKVNGKIMIK